MITASLAVSLPRMAFAEPALLQAVQLQNGTGPGGFVRVGSDPALAPQRLTLQVVIRPEGVGSGSGNDEYGCHVVAHTVEGDYHFETDGYVIRWSPLTTRVNFQLACAPDTGAILYSNALIPIGTTAQVSASFDGVTARLYVNGVLDNEMTTGFSSIWYHPESNLRFGAGNGPDPYLRRFQGTIDNVRLWDRALSADAIACNVAHEPSALIGAWTFNNGSFADVSGHGHGAVAEGLVMFIDQPIVSPLPGDFTGDGLLSIEDLRGFVNDLLLDPGLQTCAGDLNGDELVDGQHIQFFIAALGL
jgi:hypothetical protein